MFKSIVFKFICLNLQKNSFVIKNDRNIMKKQLLALALIPAAFVGCTDDSYDLDNISNDFRIGLNEYLPIASSSVNLKDILEEFKTEYIREDDSQTLIFDFDTTTYVNIKPFDIKFDEQIFEYETKDISELEKYIDFIPFGSTAFPIKVPFNVAFSDENGEGKIDSIKIKNSIENTELQFYVEVNEDETDVIQIRDIVEFPGSVDWRGDLQVLRLQDKTIDFTKQDSLTLMVQVTSGNKINLVNGTAKIKVKMLECKLAYDAIYGSFKSKTEQIQRTDFDINLYDDNLLYKLNVVDPTITISGLTNSGIPMYCELKSLVGKHKGGKDSVQATFIENGHISHSKEFGFNASPIFKDSVVAFKEQKFDKNNGGLDKIFNYLPDSVSVACALRFDADPESGVSYFLLDSTFLKLNIHASVPLQIGDSSYLIIRDTVDGIDILEDITDYQNGEFKLDQAEVFIEFENGLPLEGEVIAQFCTADTLANGNVVLNRINNKKLDQKVKIPAAKVGVDGCVQAATPSKTKISLSDDLIDDIKRINAVDFKYTIKVPAGNHLNGVFLQSNNSMSAKVYAHVKANISKTEDK